MTVAEPGYFRTGFLNQGAAVQSEKRLEVYEKTAAGELVPGWCEHVRVHWEVLIRMCRRDEERARRT